MQETTDAIDDDAAAGDDVAVPGDDDGTVLATISHSPGSYRV